MNKLGKILPDAVKRIKKKYKVDISLLSIDKINDLLEVLPHIRDTAIFLNKPQPTEELSV